MTKEEKIKEAYGEYYEELKSYVDVNGWINENNSSRSIFKNLDFDVRTNSMRPLELQGIENNNGWIKIESESNLPKEAFEFYDVCRIEPNGDFISDKKVSYTDLRIHYFKGNVTHYKLTEVLLPPLF